MNAAAGATAILPLDDIRVLDLSGLSGQYATRLLADLGADVLRVEPPAGSEARRQPPFYHDDPDVEKSLAFWYFNANKRSITLNLDTADGRALFEQLLDTADVVVDGLAGGSLARAGFDVVACHERWPGLIWATIRPFGAWGPHSNYLGPDLVVLAMSGVLTLSGYPDRAPTMHPGQQAYIAGSIQAAQGVLMALLERDTSGLGQGIEVSLQEALSLAQETAMQTFDLRGEVRRRQGDTRLLPGIGTYPCADGYVYSMVGVPGFGAPWTVLSAWMDEEGQAGDLMQASWQELLASTNMRQLTALLSDPEQLAEVQKRFDYVNQVLAAFMLSHTKAELYEGGQRRRLLIGPVNSPRDLLEDEQLRAREWYATVPQPSAEGEAVYPGPPFRFSEVPWAIRRPPPMLGEHNLEVYGAELGLNHEQLRILAGAGAI